MRRTLGPSAAAALLVGCLTAGCGTAEETADDPGPRSGSPSDSGTDDAGTGIQVVDLVSETAAGGSTQEGLTFVDDTASLRGFAEQFSSADLVAEIRRTVDSYQLLDGRRMAAATVAIGCDVPPGVSVTPAGDDYTIRAQKVADPLPNCFAPVTTVAIVDVPELG